MEGCACAWVAVCGFVCVMLYTCVLLRRSDATATTHSKIVQATCPKNAAILCTRLGLLFLPIIICSSYYYYESPCGMGFSVVVPRVWKRWLRTSLRRRQWRCALSTTHTQTRFGVLLNSASEAHVMKRARPFLPVPLLIYLKSQTYVS